MSINLEKILAGKRALRRDLAGRPMSEKRRMLDALRERTLTLRASTPGPPEPNALRETPAPYRTQPE